MRYQFIHDHNGQFQVRRMCKVLEVSTGGFCAWLKRGESRREREDRRLSAEFKATTDSGHFHPVAPNLLKRDFKTDMPDRKWLADITYIPTREG